MNLSTFLSRLVACLAVLCIVMMTVTLPAYAFNQSDLNKLQSTNACPSCDLTGATLRDAKLIGADLSNANLTNASLARADLHNANLNGTKLDGCKLGLANLKDAQANGTSFTGAVFYQTVMPDGSTRDN